MRTKIEKKAGVDNLFSVTFSDMQEGQIIALHNALTQYSEQSTVANDVRISLENALQLMLTTKSLFKGE